MPEKRISNRIKTDPEVKQNLPIELRKARAVHQKTQSDWAQLAGVHASNISRWEKGDFKGVPSRDFLIDATKKWSLSWQESAEILLAAKYLPELPLGFGTHPLDRILLTHSLRELHGLRDGNHFSTLLINRMSQLWSKESVTP